MSLLEDIFFAKSIPSELLTCSVDFEDVMDVCGGNKSKLKIITNY